MELDGQSLFRVVTVIAGVVFLWANLWRAGLFLTPRSPRLEVEDGSADVPVPGWLEATHERLLSLGFRPLGSFIERRVFGPTRTSWSYANDAEATYAIVDDSPLVRRASALTPPEPKSERDGPAARLTYVTTSGGRFVLSSNFRRPGVSLPGAQLCAGLPGAEPDRLFRAHQRRVAEIGGGEAPLSLDTLLERLRQWRAGEGASEVRRQHAVGLLWTLGGLGMVTGSVISLIGSST